MPLFGALMGLFLLAGSAAGMPASRMPTSTPAPQAPLSLQAPQAVRVAPTYTLTLTAYNAVPGQTDDTPFVTASGAYTNPEVVAARSQDLRQELPFGTIIAITGPANPSASGTCGYQAVGDTIGYRVVADTMNARYTNRIDVVFGEHDRYLLPGGGTMNAASILGVCPGVEVRVVGFIDISKPKNLPKTQAEVVALVEATGQALAINK